MSKEQEFYDQLIKDNVFWGRNPDNSIYIYTDGYKTQEHYDLAEYANSMGFAYVSEEFDRICGKTRLIIKLRKVA